MNPVLRSPDDHNPPDEPKPGCLVSVRVPAEFTGTSMALLAERGGIVKEMNIEIPTVVIQALIPEAQYAEFASAIEKWTQGRGKVDRQPKVE
jgi:translation elongation factor EF-G